ncbi:MULTISPECIES: hypothetical protein [Paenibacillus]|uniref:Uncharacterized protein n=1 Tax=Paenibacillus baimaensis TaxID=2982185 RepID=A0ABT2USG7_9BACL|nr:MULTISPECIES: hypothetical protein [unclassified Paenibacillus]MCU6797599.1 hypothetical protein [Paenibacillus sp. WQ 127069]OMF18577.1 hypothetical protein BK127_08930 [Paenibacillus sp. FSL H7-0331]
MRERTVVREKRSLIGYDDEKVKSYIHSLQLEIRALERRRREDHQVFMNQSAELLGEIDQLKQKAHELDQMENNLKQWIQRNQ